MLGDHSLRDMPDEPGLLEVNAIPMGVALWRLSMFKDMPKPWFGETPLVTQDIFFCKKAREAGYRFLVDCSLSAGHLNVETGNVY
jgi:hypothetical protein